MRRRKRRATIRRGNDAREREIEGGEEVPGGCLAHSWRAEVALLR